MIRAWFRQWLDIGHISAAQRVHERKIEVLEERNRLAWERLVSLEQSYGELAGKFTHTNIDGVLLEVRQLREMLNDPKSKVIVAKTTHQFRALMEMDQ